MDRPSKDVHRSNDMRRTAYHESGHALAGWLYDRPLAMVSIRPGQTYGGVTQWEAIDRTWTAEFDADAPGLLQPVNVRNNIEREIVVALAGPIAAALAMPASGFYLAEPCEVEAEREAAGLAALSPRAQELVLAVEAGPAQDTDEEQAGHLSHGLTGSDEEAAAHLTWLRITSRGLVIRHWHRLAALADVLLTRRVLDGDSAVQILSNAQRGASNAH